MKAHKAAFRRGEPYEYEPDLPHDDGSWVDDQPRCFDRISAERFMIEAARGWLKVQYTNQSNRVFITAADRSPLSMKNAWKHIFAFEQ